MLCSRHQTPCDQMTEPPETRSQIRKQTMSLTVTDCSTAVQSADCMCSEAEASLYHTLTSKIPCTILDQFSYPLISLPNKRSLDTTSSAKTGFASSVFPSCQTELNAFAAFISCSHQQGTVSKAQSAWRSRLQPSSRHSQQSSHIMYASAVVIQHQFKVC